VTFIGPTSKTIRAVGDKIESMRTCEIAKAPLIPWSGGAIPDPATAIAKGKEIGFPLMIKATDGGGGRGIRRVDREEDMEEMLEEVRLVVVVVVVAVVVVVLVVVVLVLVLLVLLLPLLTLGCLHYSQVLKEVPGSVFLMKLMENAMHLEIQIIGDGEDVRQLVLLVPVLLVLLVVVLVLLLLVLVVIDR